MKKTLFVFAVAAVLVFAVASTAFAASGQDRQGAAANAPGIVGSFATGVLGQTNPVAGAGTYTYMNWGPLQSAGGNAGDNSPHGNYTTTTVKCVVCHAVHYAAPGMAPVGGGQQADTLLRMKASDACVYCHATANVAVNGVPVYADGVNDGHVIGTNCDECHTGVHAAGADDSVASLRGFLLKTMTVTNTQNQGSDTNSILEAATAIDAAAQLQGFAAGAALGYNPGELAAFNTADARTSAVGVFCAQCHFGSYATHAAGSATNVNGSATTLFAGHRVGADVVASTSWNSDGSISSGREDIGQIAWKPATSCNSCHDATYDSTGDVAFPHGWGGSAMWLTNADDATVNPTVDTVAGAGGIDANVPQLSDGICLKCHVGDATAGVGITF